MPTNRLKIFLFAAAALGLAGLLFEGGARFYRWLQTDLLRRPGQETLAFAAEDLSPYVFFRALPALEARAGENYFFEFDGQRVEAQKAPGEYRIFILGGSAALGYGASTPEKKFYRLAEKLLNGHKPDGLQRSFRLIAAANLGYVSAQELVYLMMGVLDYHPDFVLHFNGANDVLAVTQYQEPPGYPFYFHRLALGLKAAKLGRALDEAMEQSAFLAALGEAARKYGAPPLAADRDIVRHYTRNMRQSAQLLRANGVGGLFALQPVLPAKKQLSGEEQARLDKMRGPHIPLWQNAFAGFAAALQGIAADTQMEWADFRGVFDGAAATVFTDTVHFNDYGQEILAQALFERLQPLVYR